jgi:hypothetical protein
VAGASAALLSTVAAVELRRRLAAHTRLAEPLPGVIEDAAVITLAALLSGPVRS